jgi:mono/diheme cytochrome c family protein
MTSRIAASAAASVALGAAWVAASRAQAPQPVEIYTAPLSIERTQVRPPIDNLPVPLGFSKEQIALGDRVFQGEAAAGKCAECHGKDAKGTPIGNDLTTGMYVWGDGSVQGIKNTLLTNMKLAPGRDGDLTPADVDAVAAYIWALGRQPRT